MEPYGAALDAIQQALDINAASWDGAPPLPTAAQTRRTWKRIEKVVQAALDTPLPEIDEEHEQEQRARRELRKVLTQRQPGLIGTGNRIMAVMTDDDPELVGFFTDAYPPI